METETAFQLSYVNHPATGLPMKPIGKVRNYFLLQEIDPGLHLYPVFKAYNPETFIEQYRSVVIKFIPIDDEIGSLVNERAISQLVAHTNILKALETIPDIEVELERLGAIKRFNLIVYPCLPNGDFFDLVKKYPLNESAARFSISQIADAVQYLHRNGYVHLDIKLENILVDGDYNLNLGDFGSAVKHSDAGPKSLKIQTTSELDPPEYHLKNSYNGIEKDLFTLGRLLFQMLTGIEPFAKASKTDTFYSMIFQGKWDNYWKFIESRTSSRFSPELKTLIQGLLEPIPERRYGMTELRESEWFKNTKPLSLKEFISLK